MILQESLFLKRILLWGVLIACCLLAAYFSLISVVCIWVGLDHLDQPGFWVPILAGTFLFLLLLWVFSRTLKRILIHLKEEDVVNV